MSPKEKLTIDLMSYQAMLSRVRFDMPGSAPYFDGSERAAYFWERWCHLCEVTPSEERVAASKALGW